MQKILSADNNYKDLDEYLVKRGIKSVFLVCGKSASRLNIGAYFDNLRQRLGIKTVRFDRFKPNPDYESVEEGVALFKNSACDCIAAVGGGSAIDVAKCIKLFCNMRGGENYLRQKITPNDVKFIAVPTTAGTGSEATRFAVIYYKGEKQSVTHDGCIPDAVLFDSSSLKTLPDYHRKSTMLDALCHCIESYWSVNSTAESKRLAVKGISLILGGARKYLENDEAGNREMMFAAYTAGQAINITQTTAGHALCYKLTGLFDLAHGHAAALCVSGVWSYMLNHRDECADPRGKEYLEKTFFGLAEAFDCKTPRAALDKFNRFLDSLDLSVPKLEDSATLDILVKSVNVERLNNNPVKLSDAAISKIYREICDGADI